jgi:geranylgeranyl pyrophosphate synthase
MAKRNPGAGRLMGAGGNMHRKFGRRFGVLAALALLLCAATAFAASKKGEDQNVRSVQGTVTDASDNAIDGAVVQLKNTKNLQIRSFIAKEHGAYYFHGLSPDVDYELKADYQGQSSPTKTLSAFDSRKQAVINLKLNKK